MDRTIYVIPAGFGCFCALIYNPPIPSGLDSPSLLISYDKKYIMSAQQMETQEFQKEWV